MNINTNYRCKNFHITNVKSDTKASFIDKEGYEFLNCINAIMKDAVKAESLWSDIADNKVNKSDNLDTYISLLFLKDKDYLNSLVLDDLNNIEKDNSLILKNSWNRFNNFLGTFIFLIVSVIGLGFVKNEEVYAQTFYQCMPCRAGYYSDGSGGGCTPCPLGTYSKIPMAEECISCPDGHFTRDVGSISCEMCPSGYFCVEGIAYFCPSSKYHLKECIIFKRD